MNRTEEAYEAQADADDFECNRLIEEFRAATKRNWVTLNPMVYNHRDDTMRFGALTLTHEISVTWRSADTPAITGRVLAAIIDPQQSEPDYVREFRRMSLFRRSWADIVVGKRDCDRITSLCATCPRGRRYMIEWLSSYRMTGESIAGMIDCARTLTDFPEG